VNNIQVMGVPLTVGRPVVSDIFQNRTERVRRPSSALLSIRKPKDSGT